MTTKELEKHNFLTGVNMLMQESSKMLNGKIMMYGKDCIVNIQMK